MRARTGRAAALVVAVAAAALLAGCAGGGAAPAAPSSSGAFDLDALVAAAKQEGALTLYGDAAEDKLKAWAADFTGTYGIPVTVLRNGPSPLYQRFSQEEAAGQGQADVLAIVDHALLDQGVKNGWIAKYTPQEAGALPADVSRAGYYYAVENITSEVIAYNTNNVTADEVKQLKADPMAFLTKAAAKGRVGSVAPQFGQAIEAFWYLYSDGPAAKQYGWKNLRGIGANTGKVSDTVTTTQNLIQGEVDFALPIADGYVTSFITSKAPLGYVYPNPSVDVSSDLAVVEKAPHPNAARLFAEWAASKAGTSSWATNANVQPVRSDVPDPRTYLKAPWYTAKQETWSGFATDTRFLAAFVAGGTYFDTWDKAFGYSG